MKMFGRKLIWLRNVAVCDVIGTLMARLVDVSQIVVYRLDGTQGQSVSVLVLTSVSRASGHKYELLRLILL